MLRSICVQNYRTFKEQFTLEIAPLTILLGANSSGKSSVTRLPPLISQSLSERTSAPILWVSDTIDFGSFRENVHRHDLSGKISLTLGGELTETANALMPFGITTWQNGEFSYTIDIAGEDDSSRISRIKIQIYGEVVEMDITHGWALSIKFKDKSYRELSKNMLVYVVEGLFPTPYYFTKDGDKYKAADRDVLKKDLIRILRQYSHANTTDAALYKVFSYPRMGSVAQTFDWLKVRARQVPSLFKRFDQITTAERERIWLNLFFSSLGSLMTSLQSSVAVDVSNGGYLAPIRAAAERYYRHREVAVGRIDPDGGNLAMYLNSLYPYELQQINDDLYKFFGHRVKVHRSEGHISLRITSSDEYEDNLADVGFGFSQLIPVIAQIHAASRSLGSSKVQQPDGASAPIIAIEQPELHLHPAFQAQLGSYFVNAAQAGRGARKFRFLIETHSEPLVNEVARLVALGQIRPEDVNIYLFERDGATNTTKVERVHVREDGTLLNWPFGFFSSGKLNNMFGRGPTS